MRCLLFQLGEGHYALPMRDILEVLPLLPLREVPRAPPYIAGLIKYRGEPVPVVDLRALALGRPCEERMTTRLVVVPLPRGEVSLRLALMVERAVDVVVLSPEDVARTPAPQAETPYLGGLAVNGTELTQLVSVDRLLPEAVLGLLYPEEVA